MIHEAFEPGSIVIAQDLPVCGAAGLLPPPATTILPAQSPSLLLVVLPCWSAVFLLFFWNVLVGCEPQVIEYLTGGQEWVGTGLQPGLGAGEANRKEAGSWSEDGVPGGETHFGGSQAHSLGNFGLSGTSCAFRARGLASGARAVTSMGTAGLASGPWF